MGRCTSVNSAYNGDLRLFAHCHCRYAVPHVPWRRLAEAPSRPGRDWKALVERLLGLTYAVAELTLPVLSKPQVGWAGLHWGFCLLSPNCYLSFPVCPLGGFSPGFLGSHWVGCSRVHMCSVVNRLLRLPMCV